MGAEKDVRLFLAWARVVRVLARGSTRRAGP
jgi:hypothetical protein